MTFLSLDVKIEGLCAASVRGCRDNQKDKAYTHIHNLGAEMTTMSTLSLTSASDIARRHDVHCVYQGLCDSYTTSKNIEPQIDGQRLWDNIVRTSHYGLIPGTTGMNRLALSESDRQIRDWFRKEAEDIGCRMKVDSVGNMFAILPGINNQVPPIGIGSHLDTQPSGKTACHCMYRGADIVPGGRFDGILGVIGALEVLRTIKASGIKHYAPFAAINWTNEYGHQVRTKTGIHVDF